MNLTKITYTCGGCKELGCGNCTFTGEFSDLKKLPEYCPWDGVKDSNWQLLEVHKDGN